MSRYADVVLPLPLDRAFVYSVPDRFQSEIAAGARVMVPFNRRILTGFVVGLRQAPPSGGFAIKPIRDLMDRRPAFSSELLRFTRELSARYHSSWGEMLQAALPPSLSPRSRIRYVLTEEGSAGRLSRSLTAEERRILAALAQSPYTEAYLRGRLKFERAALLLQRLERKGLIRREQDLHAPVRRRPAAAAGEAGQLQMDFSLDREAMEIARSIGDRMAGGGFSLRLLRAPEEIRRAVYIDLIRTCLRMKKRVLYLVPEIALTEGTARSIRDTVGPALALMHSRLTDRQREAEWRRIRDGEAQVVLGSRSALLAPVEDLGLIILDDEQDESYYQRESPAYDARAGARLRAERAGAVVVYGSARPSVEILHRAREEGWLSSRMEGAAAVSPAVLDDTGRRGLVSEQIHGALKKTLEAGDQALVFCNRRGYAAYLSCSRCRHVPRCGQCDVTLAYHKRRGRLVCHACNASSPVPESCPVCGGRIVRRRGYGVEVVEEELRRALPEARIAGFHTDEAGTRRKQEDLLTRFRTGRLDLLVGTRLLARKGELSPVSLVVIYFPEIGLDLPDFRMSQKTFEDICRMLDHLRKDGAGSAFIRTALPDHFSIRTAAAGDYDSFAEEELSYRRLMRYPPFTRMAEVLLEGESLRKLAERSRALTTALKRAAPEIEILGPALAPVARVRGRSRIQVILKDDGGKLDEALAAALKGVPGRRTVRLYE